MHLVFVLNEFLVVPVLQTLNQESCQSLCPQCGEVQSPSVVPQRALKSPRKCVLMMK